MQRGIPRFVIVRSTALVGFAVPLLLAGCSGGSAGTSGSSGTVTTTLSDPPTCKAPQGDFMHVWVTVTRVRAHRSGSAGPSDADWVDLVDRRSDPLQIDLLDTPSTSCVLATLGATTGLRTGRYQQIRLHLLSNDPQPGEVLPIVNACEAVSAFNGVETVSDGLQRLELSSADETGLKIPSGQITGGAIVLRDGEAADIDLDFDACRSIARTGSGGYRLKPTLHAGEVSVAQVIDGRAVDTSTGLPISGATVLVLVEQVDAEGIRRVIRQTLADPTAGTFSVCPLPLGTYDVVIAAVDSTGKTFGSTVTFAVPTGTDLGDVPLFAVGGTSTPLAEIDGVVTTAPPGGSGVDVEISPLLDASLPGSPIVLVTIPVFGTSTPLVTTTSGASCDAGTDCASYVLFVTAGRPSIGTFDPAGTTWMPPDGATSTARVNARAFDTASGGVATCAPSSSSTSSNAGGGPLTLIPGASSTAATLAFVECGQTP